MQLSIKRLFLLIGSTLFLFSCRKENIIKDVKDLISPEKDNTYKGPNVTVGNGLARTFITVSHDGKPKELGIIFTHEAHSGLPATNTPYVLELPKKALETTPFKHVALGWSANGHPLPNNSYMGPHFDIRFFMMTNQERLAIPAPPAPEFFNLPPPGYMPANYFPFLNVVQLGLHWTDESFASGAAVNHTMILGSYAGKFTFVSPIVTQTELASGQRFSVAYAQPRFFAEHGYYPTRYNIYEDDKGSHYVTLSHFVWR